MVKRNGSRKTRPEVELVTTSIRVPPDLWVGLRVLATQKRTTAQAELAEAIAEYLAARRAKA